MFSLRDSVFKKKKKEEKGGKEEEDRNQFQGFKDFVLRTWAQKYNVSIISSTYHRKRLN